MITTKNPSLEKKKTDYLAALLEDYADGLEGHWIVFESDYPVFAEDLRNAAKTIRALSRR